MWGADLPFHSPQLWGPYFGLFTAHPHPLARAWRSQNLGELLEETDRRCHPFPWSLHSPLSSLSPLPEVPVGCDRIAKSWHRTPDFFFPSLCRDMEPRKCQLHNSAPAEPCKLPQPKQLNRKWDGAGNLSLSAGFSIQQLIKNPTWKQPEPLQLSPIWEMAFNPHTVYLTLHDSCVMPCCSVLILFHREAFQLGKFMDQTARPRCFAELCHVNDYSVKKKVPLTHIFWQ